MKSISKIMIISALMASAAPLSTRSECGIYKAELKALKKKQPYKVMLDRHANGVLRDIIRDVENFKEMPQFQRMLRFMFLNMDTVVVTPATMPKLHGYVDSICKKQGIKTPVMFITKDKWCFSAMAAKLFASSGGILIGQDLLNEVVDDELEAVIAHEVGHIVHNHINKSLATNLGVTAASSMACGAFLYNYYQKILRETEEHVGSLPGIESMSSEDIQKKTIEYVQPRMNFFFKALVPTSVIGALVAAGVISSLIIGKRHERQADRFAYESTGKGKGIITFFEHLQRKDQEEKDAFGITADVIDSNPQLPFGERFNLKLRFRLAKLGYKIDSAFRWWYYNTPFGPHPSHSSRIEAAREYLNTQEA